MSKIVLCGEDKILIRLERKPFIKMSSGDFFMDYDFFIEDSTVSNAEELRNLSAILPATIFQFTQPTEINGQLYIVISANNLICART